MQALASYSPDHHATVQAEVLGLEDALLGLEAGTYLAARGYFARFVWPDWPQTLTEQLVTRVKAFVAQHPQLTMVGDRSPEWDGVFHGWRSDPESAKVIADAFAKNFGDRLVWVESERDGRGRIGGTSRIKSLTQPVSFSPDHPLASVPRPREESDAERFSMQLTWKDSFAPLPGPMTDADRAAFESSVQEVFDWASQRVKTVLDTLHIKLRELYSERFRGLYVFGSYARPDAGIELPEDSDLDVALLLSELESPYEEIKRFGQITSDLSLEHGLVISLVPIREGDFKEGRTNFTRVISEYAIPVK